MCVCVCVTWRGEGIHDSSVCFLCHFRVTMTNKGPSPQHCGFRSDHKDASFPNNFVSVIS